MSYENQLIREMTTDQGEPEPEETNDSNETGDQQGETRRPPTVYLSWRDRHVVAKRPRQGIQRLLRSYIRQQSQAYKRQSELGDNWEVIRFGRQWLVAWKVGAPFDAISIPTISKQILLPT